MSIEEPGKDNSEANLLGWQDSIVVQPGEVPEEILHLDDFDPSDEQESLDLHTILESASDNIRTIFENEKKGFIRVTEKDELKLLVRDESEILEKDNLVVKIAEERDVNGNYPMFYFEAYPKSSDSDKLPPLKRFRFIWDIDRNVSWVDSIQMVGGEPVKLSLKDSLGNQRQISVPEAQMIKKHIQSFLDQRMARKGLDIYEQARLEEQREAEGN